jgi:hypothetical protein
LSTQEVEGRITRLIDRLGDNVSPSVQTQMRRKPADLSEECEERRERIAELEDRLATAGCARLGLPELFEQCQAGLASALIRDQTEDHVPILAAQLAGAVLFLADPHAEVAREVKRRVLLSLGAHVVVRDHEVHVSLCLPLVLSAPRSGDGRWDRKPISRLQVAP